MLEAMEKLCVPPELVEDSKNMVGESLVWNQKRNTLHWVDIIQKQVYSLDFSTKKLKIDSAPDFITSIGLTDDGRAIIGLIKEVVLWDFDQVWLDFATIEGDNLDVRLNEGVVGPDGQFWVGTMQKNFTDQGLPLTIDKHLGRIYRIAQSGKVSSPTDDLFGITNTFVWPNASRFVTADTLTNTLYDYPLSPSGELGQRQVLLKDYARGLPDGSCVDEEGYVWNCRVVGGACVVRICPNGEVDRVVELPCTWPTSCAFAGPNLNRLFITSARFSMNSAHLEANPHEGGLFSIDVGVKGLLPNLFV
jgi:sugar lactone lactonase YvrE